MEKTKEHRALNNAQRKALAQVVENAYERLLKEAQDKEGLLVQEITDQVKVELGVDTLENQIAAMQSQIETLEGKKHQLGFGSYGLGERSKAKALIDARTRQKSTALHELEKERARTLTALWTAQSVEEAKTMLADIVQ